MHILHLVSYSLYSGPMPSTLGLALAQRALGHTVSLAYDRKRGAINDYEEAAAPWLDDHGLEPSLPLTLSAKSSPLEYLRDRGNLKVLVGDSGVDVVHSHLSHDHGLLALCGKTKAIRVRTVHADRSLARRFGQSWLMRRADGWLLRAEQHRQRLLSSFGVAKERTAVIAGGIDATRFAPADETARRRARERLGLPLDAAVLGHVALIADRGQEELVDAVKRLDDPRLHVALVGRGECEERVRRKIAAAGLNERIHMVGYQQGDELVETYAALDAAFLAQPGNDASARALLEAMASGLPVAAVQTGALAELVDERVGYPLTDRSPQAIGAGLGAWLRDLEAGRERGRAGRAWVEAERSFATEAQATVAFYEKLRASA